MSTPDKTTMGNLLALEQTCRRITEAKGCLYPGDAEGLYWLLDALRLALAASRDEAEKARACSSEVYALLENVETYVQRCSNGVPIAVVANVVRSRQLLSP